MANSGNGNSGYNAGQVSLFEGKITSGNLNGLENGTLIENYTLAVAGGYVPTHAMISSILALDPAISSALAGLWTQTNDSLAPVITSDGAEADGDLSLASFTIDENTSAVTTVTATDPQGDAITYALSGADAALFSIDAAGSLSFISAPNFERPQDADGDNIYDVTVTVSDGVLSDSQAISVTVEDVYEPPVVVYLQTEVVDGRQNFQATDGVDYFIYDFDAATVDWGRHAFDSFHIIGFNPDEDKLIFINAEASSSNGWGQEGRTTEADSVYVDAARADTGELYRERIDGNLTDKNLAVTTYFAVPGGYRESSKDWVVLKEADETLITPEAFEYVADATDPADTLSSIVIYDGDPFAIV